jgi:hypothetical protein
VLLSFLLSCLFYTILSITDFLRHLPDFFLLLLYCSGNNKFNRLGKAKEAASRSISVTVPLECLCFHRLLS